MVGGGNGEYKEQEPEVETPPPPCTPIDPTDLDTPTLNILLHSEATKRAVGWRFSFTCLHCCPIPYFFS